MTSEAKALQMALPLFNTKITSHRCNHKIHNKEGEIEDCFKRRNQRYPMPFFFAGSSLASRLDCGVETVGVVRRHHEDLQLVDL